MRFIIIWSPRAEQMLAAAWLNSPQRDEITRASFLLENRLQRAADTYGESRPNGVRIAFERPLGIRYRLNVRTGIVQILQV